LKIEAFAGGVRCDNQSDVPIPDRLLDFFALDRSKCSPSEDAAISRAGVNGNRFFGQDFG
jgi:hypothetical protein